MKISEMESRLQKHAEVTKYVMAAPFDIKTEEFVMTKKKFNIKKSILLAAAIICVIGTTVSAAIHFLTPSEVAENFGDVKLAASFENSNYAVETVTDGKYTASILGVVSGENLSDFKGSAWDIIPERTYAVVAVEKTDKTPMTIGEPIMVTPLIQGLKPWEYNMASMHGSYTENVIDGVLYRIIEMDSIECFADQKIYMAVTDSMFISNEHFAIDENSGEITVKEEYRGTNILFELAVDKSKADIEKATQYLIELKEGWDDETESIEEHNTDNSNDDSEDIRLITD
ncbi:MAG: hypothetical protein IJ316_03825 [Clostridia bacterium]|nr:hypothetical protein [Clostridia bacterium]